MSVNSTPFARRRRRIAEAMRTAGGGVAIVPTAPERQRNSDNDHPYRHGSDFHYLTGFAEPGAWLVIAADGRTTILLRAKNVERELWDGLRLGPDAAPAALGVDAAFPLDRSYRAGSGVTIHYRHLRIHEDQVKVLARKSGDRRLAVLGKGQVMSGAVHKNL